MIEADGKTDEGFQLIKGGNFFDLHIHEASLSEDLESIEYFHEGTRI